MADKRELTLDLLARDKTEAATRSASKNIEDYADSADHASKSTEEFGKKADQNVGHVAKLTHEIGLAEKELESLHQSFARTDDAAERIDLSRGIRRAETDLKRLNKSKGVLAALLPSPAEAESAATKLGKTVGTDVAESAGEALKSATFLGPVLAGVAIAAAPLIGATVSAAIIGGAGVGGVVGGALLASRDPRVAAAGTQLGDNLLNGLEARANVFVEPMLAGVGKLEQAFGKSGDDIGRIFTNSSKFVAPLTDGLTHFLGSVTHSLADLTDGAGPVIDELGNGVAGVGDAIEGVFEDLKDNGVDAAVALRQSFQVIEVGIEAVGAAVNGLTESYGLLAKVGVFGKDAQMQYITLEANAKIAAAANDSLAGSLESVRTAGVGVAGAAVGVVDGLKQLHDPATVAAEAADAHAAAVRGEVGAMTELNNALRAQTDPAFALITDTDKLTTAQNNAATAVKNHGRNSKEAQAATRELAAAALQLQGDVGRLGGSFDGKLSPALRATLTAAGLTEGQIADVARQLKIAKQRLDNYEGVYRAKVITDYISRFSSIVTNSAHSAYDKTKAEIAGKRAGGGPVSKGRAYVVGEHQAEVFVPDQDGTIIPSIDRAPGGSGGGSWGGAPQQQTIRVVFDVTGAEGKFKEFFRELLRTTPNLLTTTVG